MNLACKQHQLTEQFLCAINEIKEIALRIERNALCNGNSEDAEELRVRLSKATDTAYAVLSEIENA